MKRTKLLALTLVVALMLVGAGYAAWTDKLVVNTKVDTGYLDVDFVKVEKPKEIKVPIFGNVGYEDPKFMTINTPTPIAEGSEGENGDDKDLILFELTDMYPGAEGRRWVTFKNTGTLEAKINLSDLKFVETNVPEALKPFIQITAELDKDGILNPPYYPHSTGTEVQEENITTLSNSGTINLKPNDEARISVEFKMLESAPNNTEDTIAPAVYTMTLNVKQFNVK